MRGERGVYADDERRMCRKLSRRWGRVYAESLSAAERHLLRARGRLHLSGRGGVRGGLDDRRGVLAEPMPAASGYLLCGGWLVYDHDGGQLRRDVDERGELHAGEPVPATEWLVLRHERGVYDHTSGELHGSVGDRWRVFSKPVPAATGGVLRPGGRMHVCRAGVVFYNLDQWRGVLSESVRSPDGRSPSDPERYGAWNGGQRSGGDRLRGDLLVRLCHRHRGDGGCHGERRFGVYGLERRAVYGIGNVLVYGVWRDHS